MMIKNSIRQLWRMKGRTFLFLLLLFLASGLCSLGRGFWVINNRNIAKYEDTFMTIGTVEQKASSVQELQDWNAETKEYRIYRRPVYHEYIPESVLDFEGADYLSGPERRVCYGAYCPEYEMYGLGMDMGYIIEATPLEDVVPDHPVQLKVTKVLYGSGLMENVKITFCDHWNPEPEMLYQGKTYVMHLALWPGHESEKEFSDDDVQEYRPSYDLVSTQTDTDGIPMENTVGEEYFYDEVTEGFYETETGKRWMNQLACMEYLRHIFPVSATENIYLMMAFYRGDVYISSGREFTEEEYDQGSNVCLVSEQFANKNGLALGDKVTLPLILANYEGSTGWMFSSSSVRIASLLNAKGEIYQPFENNTYEIVGIYGGMNGAGDDYGMGYQEIVVPRRSIRNSDENNIIYYGPMKGYTTSFQIENGTIEEYMKKWEKLGIDDVEITFYDKGYTRLRAGIENMKNIARLLVVMGTVMVLLVLGYFTWLFILKQKERTAVERCLGFTRRQSFWSLFSGILLLLLAGSISGCLAGASLSGKIAGNIGESSYYDTSFGNSAAVTIAEIQEEGEDFYPAGAAMETMLGILLAGSIIAGAGIIYNLRQEPMEMLGK